MMNRRTFLCGLTLGTLSAPLTVDAQQPGKVARIGVLSQGSSTSGQHIREAFRQGLRDLGYVEGQNIVIEYRYAEGKAERLPDLAAELLRLKVDVIVAGGAPAPPSAHHATVRGPVGMPAAGRPRGTRQL